MNTKSIPGNFYVKDCALSAIVMGEKAFYLKELYEKLQAIHPGCIYYHFWGGRLRPHFEVREYHNDFAMWAFHHLHDRILAERLAIIDPTDFDEIEELRKEILHIIEARLEETESASWIAKVEPFHFIRSQIIVFETPFILSTPNELLEIIPKLSLSSIFYHCIDANQRLPIGRDDFSFWLENFGDRYQKLAQEIQDIDVYFMSLSELQQKLQRLITNYLLNEAT